MQLCTVSLTPEEMFSIKLKLMVFFHGLEISLELKLFIVCKLNQNSAC